MSLDAHLITSFQLLRVQSYVGVAAAALYAYDYLLTFNRELALIWPTNWSFIKTLFFLTRYSPLVDVTIVLYYQLKPNITAKTCHTLYAPAGWIIVLGIAIAEAILLVRTWSIWGREKRLAIVLGTVFVLAAAAVTVIEHKFLKSLSFAPHPGRATPGCRIASGNPIIAVNFVIVILLETLVLILTLIKGFEHRRLAGEKRFIKAFIAVLYRDGIIFFVYLFIASIVNLLVILTAPRDIADMLVILQRVLHSSLTARVLLNLREARIRDEAPLSVSDVVRMSVLVRHGQRVSSVPPRISLSWLHTSLTAANPKNNHAATMLSSTDDVILIA